MFWRTATRTPRKVQLESCLCGGGGSHWIDLLRLHTKVKAIFVNLRAISAALNHPEVIKRFKKREWYPGELQKDERSQYTTMALLEMLTGYRAEYVYNNEREPPGVKKEGNWGEYQTGFAEKDKFLEWILGKTRNLPTANWIPTVIKSEDGGLRGVKPFPKGESFKKVYLQDTRAQPAISDGQVAPDFTTEKGRSEAYDRERDYDWLWNTMKWICRIKVSENNMSPLEGTDLFAGYFEATDKS